MNLVFDFGRGALDSLIKQGLNYYDLDAIFISHFYSDHFSELATLLHISLIEHPDRQLRKKDLIIYGPKGFGKVYDYSKKAFYLEEYQLRYKVVIKELEDNDID